jgi:DNA-binding NarL/FixJ family response regulator
MGAARGAPIVKRPRLILADDHRMVAEGLKRLLEKDFDLVGIVEDGRELVDETARTKPDVVVVDITMPRLNGLEAIPLIKKAAPGTKVVVVTMHREPAYARRAFAVGADGFVLKHAAAEDLIGAIRAAIEGRGAGIETLAAAEFADPGAGAGTARSGAAALTDRQREIVQLVAKGLAAKEIASVLGLSVRTIEFHKYRAMETLGASNVAELVRIAIESAIAKP